MLGIIQIILSVILLVLIGFFIYVNIRYRIEIERLHCSSTYFDIMSEKCKALLENKAEKPSEDTK